MMKKLFLNGLFGCTLVFLVTCSSEQGMQPPDDNGDNGNATHPQRDIPWPSLADSPWPMYLHDPQHTGRSPLSGPDSGIVLWSVDLGGEIFSSPAIGADGAIYVGTGRPSTSVFAVNPDGSIKWQFQTEGSVDSSPLVAADGTIYIGSDDGNLYALDESGNLKWEFETGGFFGFSSPSISKNGQTIYVQVRPGLVGGQVTGNDFLYALNLDGTVKWRFEAEETEEELQGFAPALSPDSETIYAPARGSLYAIRSDGSLKWKFIVDGNAAPPSVDSDGNIYVNTGNTTYSISPDGESRWMFSLLSINIKFSAVSIGWDGTLYVENLHELDALDYEGRMRWRLEFSDLLNVFWSEATPVVDVNGSSYLGLVLSGERIEGTNLVALNKNGSLKFQASLRKTDGFLPDIDSFPAIGDNGILYVGSDGKHLFAVK